MIYVNSHSSFELHINSFQQTKIRALLSVDVIMTISNNYTDFANIFLINLAAQLFEYMRINNCAIKLTNIRNYSMHLSIAYST